MILQIAQANVMLLAQYVVGSLVPLLLVPHIVKSIGLEEYGRLAVLIAWGNFGSVTIQYAFQMTGPKQLAGRTANETSATVFADIAFAKIILLSLVIPVLAVFSLVAMPLESTSSYAWVILFAMPIAAGLNSVWFLQAHGYFIEVCTLAMVGSLLTLIVGFSGIDIANQTSVDFAVAVSVFGSVFIGIGSFIMAINSIKDETYEWKIMRSINALKDGWHLFISQFVSMIYTASGPLVINHLLGSKSAGAYSVTERVISASMAAALLTHTAAYPRLASAFIHSRSSYWRMLKLIIIVYIGVTFFIANLAWYLRELVMKFLYNEINNDHQLLFFFGLSWLVLGIFGPALTGYLTVSGRSREVWPLTLKVLFLSTALGVPGVLTYGGAGWMAALVLSQLLVLQAGFKYWRGEHGKRTSC